MIVRQLRDADAIAVSNLIIRCLNEINSNYYPPEVIDRMIALYTPEQIVEYSREKLILVAEMIDEIVGMATINENFFGSVFVLPDLHHQGLGRALMDKLEDVVRASGENQVILHSSINAIQFYEKRGYLKIKDIDDQQFGKSAEMTKDL